MSHSKIDLRGHGQTTAGEGAGTLAQLSGDLDAFLHNVTGPARSGRLLAGRHHRAPRSDGAGDPDRPPDRHLHLVGGRLGSGYINAARAMIGIRSEPLNPLLENVEIPVDIIGASDDVFCPAGHRTSSSRVSAAAATTR